MISSTIAVQLGTSSSISPGASCPSDCANGRTGSHHWDLVLSVQVLNAVWISMRRLGKDALNAVITRLTAHYFFPRAGFAATVARSRYCNDVLIFTALLACGAAFIRAPSKARIANLRLDSARRSERSMAPGEWLWRSAFRN